MALPSTWNSRIVPGVISFVFAARTNPISCSLLCFRFRALCAFSLCSLGSPVLDTPARQLNFYFRVSIFRFAFFYLGSGVCATITPLLNSSTICGCRRTSVGRFARVIWSILSCSFNSAKKRPSGRGGHPTTYTSTGTMRSTPCKTEYALNGPPTLEHAPLQIHHFATGIYSHTPFTTTSIFTLTAPPTLLTS